VNDEELLAELRNAARRADAADAKGTGTALDAPLGAAFEARVAARIAGERRPARARRLWVALPSLAAAAALVLALTKPWAAHPSSALPDYGIQVTGGEDVERGADAVPRRAVSARADAQLTVLLRPAHDVGEPVAVRVFALRGASPVEVAAETRASSTGSVEVRARAGELAGSARDASIVFVVTAASSAVDARAVAGGGEPAPEGARALRVELHVLP
jgi:hypothetical protein